MSGPNTYASASRPLRIAEGMAMVQAVGLRIRSDLIAKPLSGGGTVSCGCVRGAIHEHDGRPSVQQHRRSPSYRANSLLLHQKLALLCQVCGAILVGDLA